MSVSETSDAVEELTVTPAVPVEDPEAEERRRAEAEEERQRAEEAERRRQELAEQRAREVEEHEKQEAERRARLAEARESEQRARRDALARLHNLLGRVEPLIARTDLSLKAADRALRDVRTALNAIPPLPSRQDFEEVARRLRAAQDGLTPKVLELREAEDWQRWANVSVQEQLIAKMEGLKALDDAETIAREVRSLQEQWKKVADVPRPQADALWRRFKTAHDEVWTKCEAHFAVEAQVRAENLARKIALCEKAEALAESTNWIQTAEEIKRLQAEWKAIGPVSRGREKAIWDRFRTACDRFFTRRHDDLAQRKKLWAENLAKKDALCVRAETLSDSSDWEPAAAEIRRLQADWKAIGPVKKSRSEAVWQRFRAACDKFFTRYAQRHDIARAERVAAREAICDEMAALAPRRSNRVRLRRRKRPAGRIEPLRRREPERREQPPICWPRCARCGAAGNRRSRRAASTPSGRRRSTAGSQTPSPPSWRAGRRRLPVPTSIQTPTASGWKRSSAGLKTSRRRSPARPRRRPRPTQPCRQRSGSPRC